MSGATKALAACVKEKGIQISAISNKTGIPYGRLWSSLSPNGNRELRADEFLSVCRFIGKDPMDFCKFKDSA